MFGLSKKDFISVVVLNILWGSAFAIAGYAYRYFSSLFVYSTRFLIAGILGVLVFKINDKKNLKNIFIMGFLQAVSFISIAFGVKYLNSSTASIITRLDIIFTIVLGVIFHGEKITKNLIIGLLMCIGAILIINKDVSLNNFKWLLFSVFGSIASGGVNIFSRTIKNESKLSVVSWSSLICGLFILAAAFLVEYGTFITPRGYEIFTDISNNKIECLKAVSCILYGAIFVSFLFYVVFFDLLQNNPSTKIMPYSFIRPVVGVIAGLIVLGEPITLYKIVSIILVLGGVLLSQYSNQKK
jgi:O-acetylserine/cysteine efflux transporter